ncbi:RNA polymerase sigma factor [Flavivirga eckloniae]|uniref:RNA polymerase sigma factor n=1 Tax=Flavivirga eckloniae TaxID=1803846 RepID=UPI00131523C9|nr:sigma-70 family RNA polymerase sigma factor [Flavivirga eckloniae]
MNTSSQIQNEVNQLYRNHFGKLVASLTYLFNLSNLQVSEDIVQDTFIAALENWTKNGIPKEPVNWLYKVCKNKALNVIKSKRFTHLSPLTDVSLFESKNMDIGYKMDKYFQYEQPEDMQLQLLFSICHPKIPQTSQIILALKTICGFSRSEIAKGLGMNEESVKKNLYRTKKKIADEKLVFKIPYSTKSIEKIHTVEFILYLMFNEGYKASAGNSIVKYEFCLEAMKLTKSLLKEIDLKLDTTKALFALMLFNASRIEERNRLKNELNNLETQNRNNWDKELIHLGIEYLNNSKPRKNLTSRFHLEASIASIHCKSKSFNETNWLGILRFYDSLVQINPSAYTHLNRCIAMFYAHRAEQALKEIERLNLNKELNSYYLFNCTMGKIYKSIEKYEIAASFYKKALNQTKNNLERAYIRKQMN